MSPVKPSAQPTLVRTQHLPPRKAPRSGPLRVVAAGRLASYGTVNQRRRRGLAFSLVRGLPTWCAVPGPGLLWLRGGWESRRTAAGCWGRFAALLWWRGDCPGGRAARGAGRHLAGVAPRCAGRGIRTAVPANSTVRKRADRGDTRVIIATSLPDDGAMITRVSSSRSAVRGGSG